MLFALEHERATDAFQQTLPASRQTVSAGKIAFALVLVDREEGGREAIEGRGIPVVSLFTRSSLLG